MTCQKAKANLYGLMGAGMKALSKMEKCMGEENFSTLKVISLAIRTFKMENYSLEISS